MDSRKSSLAGVLCDGAEHQVVRINAQTGDTETVRLTGRWLYVKRCADQTRMGGIIVHPEQSGLGTFGTILAVGPECGMRKELSAAKRKRRGATCGIVNPIKPLNVVQFPDLAEWGMMRAGYTPDEYFVHEDHAIAIWDK